MLSLDEQGIILALLLGIIIYYLSGTAYLFLMFIFLALSIYVTKYGYWDKKEKGVYEYSRGWKNVISNGFFPTIFAILSPQLSWAPFAASVAAITSDKFASEIGVLDDNPRNILTFKKVKPGVSGGVSFLGILSSLSGAFLISLASIYLFSANPEVAFKIGISGFLGNVVDSIFGVLEEKGIGTKETTNAICSLSGALIMLTISYL